MKIPVESVKLKVKIRNELGNGICTNIGIPQGDCMSPIFFIVYLAEAGKQILQNNSTEEQRNGADHKVIINQQYADDISWITNVEVLKEGLVVNKTKYLGVHVDNSLDWKEHIKVVFTKLSRAIGFLKHAKNILLIASLKTFYSSILEPHFRCCCSVWGCCGKTDIDQLQKLQNRAARILTNSSFDTPSRPLIESLGWKIGVAWIRHPLAWMFHSRQLRHKIDKIQERALRITYQDYESSIEVLMEKDNCAPEKLAVSHDGIVCDQKWLESSFYERNFLSTRKSI